LSPVRRGHAALRRGRTSLPNQIYLVTFTTHLRHPVFTDDARACAMSRAVTDPRLWASSELLAWVLMPDHWHGLLALGERDYLPSLVQRVKTNTARHVRQAAPGIERVWSKAYHDRALRAEDDIVVAARYVVMNPVRAGLVQRVGQYPYWNAIWL
ncbi:MAG: transposase, partial [Lysobacter spongiicola]|nr:transposase [Lysobacter spongiicola]